MRRKIKLFIYIPIFFLLSSSFIFYSSRLSYFSLCWGLRDEFKLLWLTRRRNPYKCKIIIIFIFYSIITWEKQQVTCAHVFITLLCEYTDNSWCFIAPSKKIIVTWFLFHSFFFPQGSSILKFCLTNCVLSRILPCAQLVLPFRILQVIPIS